jgi:parallel beta-helix repeat protein
MRRLFSGIVIVLLLTSILTLTFNTRRVEAQGAIYIRADGSIDPPTAPIHTVDNFTYVLTDNITSDTYGIVVERDNTIIDGNGYTLQGFLGFGSCGIVLADKYSVGRDNVTVRNTQIKNFSYGISGLGSSNIIVSGNTVTENSESGIWFAFSINNSIVGNNVANNDVGISLPYASDSSIVGNGIAENGDWGIYLYKAYDTIMRENNLTSNNYGIFLDDYSSSWVYHNNFAGNTIQAYCSLSSITSWDDGYPSGGNYWSDYGGLDANTDGIGDMPYVVDAENVDRYPLMKRWPLLMGDVNGDRSVDMADISPCIDAFMSDSTSPNWDIRCDLNSDGSVDMGDISITICQFMRNH